MLLSDPGPLRESESGGRRSRCPVHGPQLSGGTVITGHAPKTGQVSLGEALSSRREGETHTGMCPGMEKEKQSKVQIQGSRCSEEEAIASALGGGERGGGHWGGGV